MRRYLVLVISVLILSGCNETISKLVHFSHDQAERATWMAWAERGDVEAQYKLGTLYCCGNKPEYNNQEALKWFCKAAKAGQRDAMLEVGKFHAGLLYDIKGSSIPQNDMLAFTYYRLALRKRNSEAASYITNIKDKLNETQLAEANELVQDWPYIPCVTTLNLF